MKKRVRIIFIFILILFVFSVKLEAIDEDTLEMQKESLGISEFVEEANNYTENVFENVDIENLLTSAISGEFDQKNITNSIINLLGKEIKNAAKVLGSVIVIIVIHSIMKSISDGLENKGVAQITYYVQYILIVTLILSNFSEIIVMAKDSIQNLVGFSYTLLPILLTLMISTGSITFASVAQPVLLFLITFIGNMVVDILIPLTLIGTSLGIISKLSDKIQVDKLSKFFKSGIAWILGIVLTIFVGFLSIEGTLSSSVDGITAKTAKAAVSNFVPVVGKILGDAVDSVIGCASILKSAVGVVGVVVIIGICIIPIIKLTILTITYHAASAICQPIADGKIVELLSQMGDTFKTLLAILSSVSVMLIIGVTLVVKISNSGLMYR